MLETNPPRGRPKGSGIDDRAILADLMRRIAAEPHLKPTTAIKAAGINDPSTIRRLRDKLRLTAHDAGQPAFDAASARCAGSAAPIDVAAATPARPCETATATGPEVRETSAFAREPEIEPAKSSDLAATAEPAAKREPDPLLVAWMSLGLAAFNAALQAQQLAAEQLFRLPPFAALMRQQIAFNEAAMAFHSPRARNRLAVN